MQIIHKIGNFLYTIFPEIIEGNEDQLIKALVKYYTYGPYKPKVSIKDGWVTIDIDTPLIFTQEADYAKVISFCEKGKFHEAKPILSKLIEKNPTNSEYHRIMGQILSEEGDQDEAINSLIDALRWDSKNGWALLMMGNILAKFKDDVPTAMEYYDQAKIANPKDNIVVNNIGANLMQQGKIPEAKKYFEEALIINNEYPNTHFALGMIAEMEGDLQSAFYSTSRAIKTNKIKDVLYQNSVKQLFEIAKKIIEIGEGKHICETFKNELQKLGGTKIDIFENTDIPFAAKIEFAENYNRERHVVRYKPKYPAVEHLIMHELSHLQLVIEARKENVNKLFFSTQKHRDNFVKEFEPTIKKLKKMGIPEESILTFSTNFFDGLNTQIYNAPIDLFIEDFLYNEYAELRPYQFISLYTLVQEGIKAVTDKKIVELFPRDIVSKSKVYNLVGAIQFKELYGFDFLKDYAATPAEIKQAQAFYDEFSEYREDKKPGEEFELVIHWAEDLKLEKNFELDDEELHRKRSNMDSILNSLESDPLGLSEKDSAKEREMETFMKSQSTIGTNMAVVMFMVDALQFFENMPKEEVKMIAFEIAMQGTQGYNPDNKNYKLNSIPGKVFSGYHILAYYYVSFALAIPEMLMEMQLPYHEEYKLAKTMFKPE